MIVLNITIASHGLRPARDLRALSARRLKTRAQVFPRNHPVDLQKRLVLGVKTGIPVPKIEKPHLTHQPRLPLSTNRQPDSKSTTPGKGEFLEVPSSRRTPTISTTASATSRAASRRWSGQPSHSLRSRRPGPAISTLRRNSATRMISVRPACGSSSTGPKCSRTAPPINGSRTRSGRSTPGSQRWD